MTEENNETSIEPTEPSTPALEDLYGEFQPQTQPVQSEQPQTIRDDVRYSPVPDPVTDQDAFRGWAQDQYKEIAALKSDFSSVKTELQQEREALAAEKEEREFRTVAEEIATSAEINADDAEAGLLHKFFKDTNFQQVWKNRAQNPQAFGKVKTVLSQEMRGRFASKVDPQIAENQRALDEANNTSGQKPEKESIEDRVAKMSPSEFRNWSANMRDQKYV